MTLQSGKQTSQFFSPLCVCTHTDVVTVIPVIVTCFCWLALSPESRNCMLFFALCCSDINSNPQVIPMKQEHLFTFHCLLGIWQIDDDLFLVPHLVCPSSPWSSKQASSLLMAVPEFISLARTKNERREKILQRDWNHWWTRKKEEVTRKERAKSAQISFSLSFSLWHSIFIIFSLSLFFECLFYFFSLPFLIFDLSQ